MSTLPKFGRANHDKTTGVLSQWPSPSFSDDMSRKLLSDWWNDGSLSIYLFHARSHQTSRFLGSPQSHFTFSQGPCYETVGGQCVEAKVRKHGVTWSPKRLGKGSDLRNLSWELEAKFWSLILHIAFPSMVAPATECFLASAGSAKETRSRHGSYGWLRPSIPSLFLQFHKLHWFYPL